MPVRKAGKKYKMGTKTYKSKASAERSYTAYRAKKHSRSK